MNDSDPRPEPQHLFVCVSRAVESLPKFEIAPDEIREQHVAYLQDLFDTGVLFGSGPQHDAAGNQYGGSVMILQNVDTIEKARSVAALEPFTREGQRTAEVFAWRRVWFGG